MQKSEDQVVVHFSFKAEHSSLSEKMPIFKRETLVALSKADHEGQPAIYLP